MSLDAGAAKLLPPSGSCWRRPQNYTRHIRFNDTIWNLEKCRCKQWAAYLLWDCIQSYLYRKGQFGIRESVTVISKQ